MGSWKTVEGGIDQQIEFAIENKKHVFDSNYTSPINISSSTNEVDGISLHPSIINASWKYDRSGLTIGSIGSEQGPSESFVFDQVTFSDDGILKLSNSLNHELDGIYSRIKE